MAWKLNTTIWSLHERTLHRTRNKREHTIEQAYYIHNSDVVPCFFSPWNAYICWALLLVSCWKYSVFLLFRKSDGSEGKKHTRPSCQWKANEERIENSPSGAEASLSDLRPRLMMMIISHYYCYYWEVKQKTKRLPWMRKGAGGGGGGPSITDWKLPRICSREETISKRDRSSARASILRSTASIIIRTNECGWICAIDSWRTISA